MQPGWYPDPWAQGWLRWWDGQTWSPHVAPSLQQQQPRYLQVPYDVARERRLMKIALVPVVAIGHLLHDPKALSPVARH